MGLKINEICETTSPNATEQQKAKLSKMKQIADMRKDKITVNEPTKVCVKTDNTGNYKNL
jgi:hypothetical protein